jgi:hypothetical protein
MGPPEAEAAEARAALHRLRGTLELLLSGAGGAIGRDLRLLLEGIAGSLAEVESALAAAAEPKAATLDAPCGETGLPEGEPHGSTGAPTRRRGEGPSCAGRRRNHV